MGDAGYPRGTTRPAGATLFIEHLPAFMADEAQAAVAPAVQPPQAPVAPQNNVPAAQSDDPAALKAKLDLVMQDKQRLGETNSQLNQRVLAQEAKLKELEEQMKSGQRSALEKSGEFKPLWEEAQQTNQALRAEIEKLTNKLAEAEARVTHERVEAQALMEMKDAGVIDPAQLQVLLRDRIKGKEGKPVALNGGVEQSLTEYLASLREPGSGYEHHFHASGVRGMGARPVISGGPTQPQSTNPYITGNLTEQVMLQARDPAMAQTLQVEAQAFRNKK